MNQIFLNYAVREAEVASERSDDPKTQVGAAVFDLDGTVLLKGANTLPRISGDINYQIYLEAHAAFESRVLAPLKDKFMEHAERNLIYSAARLGIALAGKIMAVNWFPCAPCARAIVQSGIKALIGRKPDFGHPKYGEDFRAAIEILREGNVSIHFVEEETKAT